MNLPDSVCAGFAQISPMSTWIVLLSKTTVLLAIAWLIHFTLARTNPRWRVLLWRGVVVSLILLVAWSFGLPGLEVRVPAPEAAAMMPTPSLPSVVAGGTPIRLPQPAVLSAEVPTFVEMPTTAHQSSADGGHNAALPVGTTELSLLWQAAFLGIWGCGMALLLMRLAIGHLRLVRVLPTSQAAPEWVLAEVQRIAAEVACRRAVQVRSSRRFAVPFLYGLRGPVLVLPERMCQPAYRSQLPGIVAHELAHVRSWDFGWNAGLQIVSIVLWFHPLAWRIGVAHRAACDAVCDAISVSYLGDVQVYCRTLAQVALEGAASFPAAGLAMARTCDVRRRVAALQRMVFAMPLRRRAVAVTSLVGLVAVALLAGVRLTLAQPAAATTDGQAVASSEAKTRENSLKDQRGPKTGTEGSVRPGCRPMRIHVFDSDRKPVVNAGITVRAMTSVPYGPTRYRTNAEGIGVIEVPEHGNLDLQLLIWAERRVTVGAHWRSGLVKGPIPAEFTVTMESGTTFGGIVRNEHGQPITGANVTVNGRKQSRDGVLCWSINDTSRTDAEGKWQCHRVPADLRGFDVSIRVRHPDYANTPAVGLDGVSVNELRSQNAVMVMHEGIVVEGTVTDPQGRPVAGAMVGQFIDRHVSGYPRTTTDRNGHYRLPGCDPGKYILAIVADGYAPNSRRVGVSADQRTFDLQLRQGEPIRLRVVDQEGKPVAGAVVSTVLDRETMFLDNTRSALPGNDRNLVADAEGRWSRLWIPKDELEFYIHKDGYARGHERFAPSEQEYIVTLEAGAWDVSGRVTDRETKAPVTKFRVVEGNAFGSGDDDISWQESRLVENENGQYRATWDTSGDSRRVLRIEADGYFPSDARRLEADEREVAFNVELSRGQDITGTVRSPDGKPLADAEVALCTATRGLYLKDGHPLQGQPHLIVRTGSDGHFSLPPQREPYILVVLHDQGFAQVEGEQGAKDIAIRPWARAEGTLRIGNQPGTKELIRLDFGEAPSRRQDLSPLQQIAERIHFDYQTQTDAEGHFVFERVVAGNGQIIRCVVSKHGQISSWTPTHSTEVELVAGETTQVKLSRNGRPVVGQLTIPKDTGSVPVWHFARISLQGAGPPAPEIPLPKHLDPKKDRQAVIKWWEAWKETAAGKRYQEEVKQYNHNARERRPVHYGTKVEADGSFTFDDIPAGNYQLSVQLPAPPAKGHIAPGDVIATLTHSFTVPEMPGGRSNQPLELGVLPLERRGPR